MFWPPAPDYTGAVLLLASVADYLYIDAPLTVSAVGAQNQILACGYKRFIKELGDDACMLLTPIPLTSPCNAVPQSILKAKAVAGESLSGYDIEISAYLRSFINCLIYSRPHGYDLNTEWRVFWETVRKQQLRIQMHVLGAGVEAYAFYILRYALRGWLLKAAKMSGLIGRTAGRTLAYGSEHGFHDISGALQYMEKRYQLELVAQETD
jgi:hypothetical protein